MASDDLAATLPELKEKDLPPYSPGIEKEKLDLDAEASKDDVSIALSKEPVIVDGKDVSKYVVDLRDDGDAAITFRSLVLGTLMSALTATLNQVRTTIASVETGG